jgi:signal transduction histidine kinase
VKWVYSTGRVTYSPDKRPIRFSGVVYDITERKIKEEADAAIARARDQFFMIAGHELKTPLTCLQLQLQVHEFELKNPDEGMSINWADESLKKQRRHIARITRIVDNMLDQSKIQERNLDLHQENFDLSQMVREVIDEFSVTANNAGVMVKFHPSESIVGDWDRFRLEQVLFNLLINALRYGNKSPIDVFVSLDNSHAMITVKDDGIGIKKEDHTRIFEKFERAVSGDNRDGIGLGLYISNNIVKAHKGSIQVKSETGKGSEFTVMLPL